MNGRIPLRGGARAARSNSETPLPGGARAARMTRMNRRTPFPASHARGFTLLELVLSMALTAMLLAMLSGGIYSVVSDWRRETSVLDETLDKALVVLQLERALQAAFPHAYIDHERLAKTVYFEGTADTLRFVSAISPQRQPGLMAWRLESSPRDGLALTLTPAYSDNPDPRFEVAEPTALLPGYTASFRYLLQLNPETKEWLDEWSGVEMASLPRAVLVVLTPREQNSGAQVLEIVAPIRSWQHNEIDPTTPVF